MTIHKEGYKTIAITALVLALLNIIVFKFLCTCCYTLCWIFAGISLFLWLFIISFFRIPNRKYTIDDNLVIAPCDGKVVVIEETIDEEYFKGKVLQVSIFMSPANVHVNRNPITGEVVYNQYHKGKYLVAWHPKSSTDNERWSVVIENSKGNILCKQIAGALARRICNYSKVGDSFTQGAEYGFIKFGSRVDLLLPLNAQIHAKIGDVVKGGVTMLASW
jgi:phosphatidylserine decarboxylase